MKMHERAGNRNEKLSSLCPICRIFWTVTRARKGRLRIYKDDVIFGQNEIQIIEIGKGYNASPSCHGSWEFGNDEAGLT